MINYHRNDSNRFKPTQNLTVASFIKEMALKSKASSLLYVHLHDHNVYPLDKITGKKCDAMNIADEQTLGKTYDFIYGDLPLGLKSHERVANLKIHRQNWLWIYEVSQLLSGGGLAVFGIENMLFSQEWKNFVTELDSKGVYVNSYVRFPKGDDSFGTSIRMNFVVLSRHKFDNTFIGELSEPDNTAGLVENLVKRNHTGNLKFGELVEKEFIGFDSYLTKKEITALNTQFKEYKKYSLLDISESIELGRMGKELSDSENAVFVPSIGNSNAVTNLSDTKLKHQNLIKLSLKPEIVLNDYVAIYFRSDLGRLNLDSVTTGSIIRKISKSDLSQVEVAIPNLAEQHIIIEADRKLTMLRSATDEFAKTLSLNPKSAAEVQSKLEAALESFNVLNETDRILALIRHGESKTLEFKEALSYDNKTKQKAEYLEKASMKTIAAFLNTAGGTLLIGVNDDGSITGLNVEIEKLYKSNDKLLLHFKDLIKASAGEEFYPKIEYEIAVFDGKTILKVEVEPSNKPCFSKSNEFFVRTNPSTDSLQGRELVEYIETHFKREKNEQF